MHEIRTTINWPKETDEEIITGIIKQPGVSFMLTPVGDWIYKEGHLIGLKYQNQYFFRQDADAVDYSNMFTGEAPPTRAQRTAGMRWYKQSERKCFTFNKESGKWEPEKL